MKYFLILPLIIVFFSCNNQPQNAHTAVNLDTVKVCTPDMESSMNFVTQNQFGVNVENLYHHNIFRYGAGKRIFKLKFRNGRFDTVGHKKIWVPFNGYRATLGGVLDKYYISTDHDNEIVDQDEYDWNLDITPDAAFAPYLGAGWMEGEVTPPPALRSNSWFPLKGSGLPSLLLKKKICIYGPWVKDVGNDDNKEIHPAEAIWFKDPGNTGDVILILMQDASSFRFRDNADYDFDEDGDGINDFHAGWKPWVTSPLEEEITIPFSYNPSDRKYMILDIREEKSDLVSTVLFPELNDSDNDEIHQLKVTTGQNVVDMGNLPVLVQVNERKSTDPNLGVQFSGICKSANGIIHGKIRIVTALGRLNTNDNGFQVLRFSFSSGKNEDSPVNQNN